MKYIYNDFIGDLVVVVVVRFGSLESIEKKVVKFLKGGHLREAAV